ncbi:MAG: hypothetical protein K2G26_01690, partial [Clostridia bacterium]|nr:hypothetical protein [Clostridia bacterium]
ENDYKLSASIEFAASEYTLTDISENTVEVHVPGYSDQIKYIDCGSIYVYGEQINANYIMCVGVEIKDGEVYGIKAYRRGQYDFDNQEYVYQLLTNSSYENGVLTFSIKDAITVEYSVSYEIDEWNDMRFEVELIACNIAESDTVQVQQSLNNSAYGYIIAGDTVVTSTVKEIIEAK